MRVDKPNQQAASARVLVVDDHASARESMADILRHSGREVATCASAVGALELLADASFDVIVTDMQMPGMTGLELIEQLKRRQTASQIVVVTAHATINTAVEAMRHGAFDYIEKPFTADQIESLVERALEKSASASVSTEDSSFDDKNAMVGDSPAMQSLRRRIAAVAATDETVLITGESGVGKELVARAIHAASRRRESPLVSVNCPALSPQLMESELFGHVRGAFTSADAERVGRFEMANGGALLLDEVTEIDLPLQAKLLRALQERAFERVGDSQTRHVDIRLLAATNRDLREEVSQGRFREDLYFRLAVVPLAVPPLRERKEDVPKLVDHFLSRAAQRMEQSPPSFTAAAHDLLINYHWPGNVRELENLATRACVLSGGEQVDSDDLRCWLIDHDSSDDLSTMPVGASLQEMERRMIEATLERFDGHRAKTAKALGIGVRTLSNKLRSYGYAPREKSFVKS